MRKLAVRGAGATLISSTSSLVIQLVGTVVLARILAPADFGLVAMVTTFSLLLANVGLNGFTEAILQCEHIDRFLASNLFWINTSIGLFLSITFALAGPIMAYFFRNALVVPVAIGVAPTIFLTSLSVLHVALLKRAMRFSLTSLNDIVSGAVAMLVAIIVGHAGWGYWALVAGAITSPLIQTIGAWLLCRWLPSFPRRAPGTANLIRFAVNVYGRFTTNYAARNIDNLLVGWRFNAQALGFYKKAYDLFALSAGQFVAPLANVAVSALSKVKRDRLEFQRLFLRAVAILSFVGMGLGAILTLIGKDVIRVLLGSRWDTAGSIFTFFGPGIGIMFLYYASGWVHLSIGRADRWFRWTLVEFVFTSLSFVVGLAWGPAGVAMAWTVSFWVLTIPAFAYAGKPIDLRVQAIVGVAWKYAAAAFTAGISSYLIFSRLFPSNSNGLISALARIVAVATSFSVIYIVMVVAFHRGFGPLVWSRNLLGDLLFERRPSRDFVSPPDTAVSDHGL